MLNQIKYIASWTSVKLNKRLGQRGAEMVEYAIVLACIAAVGVYFYSQDGSKGSGGLKETLETLWDKVFEKGQVTKPSSN